MFHATSRYQAFSYLSFGFFVFLALFLLACPAQQGATADRDEAELQSAHHQHENDHDHEHHDHEHGHHHDHDHDSEPPPTSDEPMDISLGEAIGEDVPLVDVEELMKKGDDYVGKTIRVEGLVTDMCHHRRGWFGVASKDGKRVVRIAVSEDFLAPEGAVGARAIAQGEVEIRTIAAEDIEHYRSAHRFLPPEALDSKEDVRLPTIMGTGASFKR